MREGFKVRGTVRSESKGEYLKKLFAGEGEFDYVVVEDITTVRSRFVRPNNHFPPRCLHLLLIQLPTARQPSKEAWY